MSEPLALCQALLDHWVVELANHALPVPVTRYIAPGEIVAYDGEQLTVNLLRLYGGQPGAQQDTQRPEIDTTTATMRVIVVRNAPTFDEVGNPPPAARSQAAGEECISYAWAFRQIAFGLRTNSQFAVPGVPLTDNPVQTSGPSGAVYAVAVDVELLLL